MFFNILKRDLKRKKTMNVILLIFIILAAMFLGSSTNNLIAVAGSVENFMDISKVPDFFSLALASGENDEIKEFLEGSEYLSEYEVLKTFNVINEWITITKCGKNPENTKYERTNTLCIESVPTDFMKVFDEEGNGLSLRQGEIAVPKLEAEENDLQAGDKLKIKIGEIEQEFRVAVITRDAVFGSSMMGYKRLLITEEDFETYCRQEGMTYTNIYCINYEETEKFQNEWKRQNFSLISSVEKDTVSMCYLFDMLFAAILIIVSICLILIAFLVLRFTIVFTLQEDYKEIGIMKAIGIKDRGIKGLYMIKYLSLSVAGAAIGALLSIPFGKMLLEKTIVNIIVESRKQNFLLNVVCAVGIVGLVLLFCCSSTNKLKKFSAMDAIRNGSDGERYQAKNHLKLWRSKRLKPVYYMAINDILSNVKRFAVLGVIFSIGTMLILLPLSAANTLRGKEIIRSFSLAPSDVYIDNGKMDLYFTEDNSDRIMEYLEEVEETLKENGIEGKAGTDLGYLVPCYSEDPAEIYNFFTLQAIGNWERNYTVLEGREPVLADEIMITEITAEKMNVSIGDHIYFKIKERTEEFIITGTFQSMLNMGDGFRVSRRAEIDYEYMAGIFCIQVELENMEDEEARETLQELFPDAEVFIAGEFLDRMIGGILEQMDVMMALITVIVLIINSLITVLMMKTIMTKERGEIALLRSIGFGKGQLKRWQSARIIFVLAAAIIIGTMLSNILAPFIIGPIFHTMGASKIKLVVNPLQVYVIYPALLLIVTGVSAVVCAGGVKKVDLKEVNTIE